MQALKEETVYGKRWRGGGRIACPPAGYAGGRFRGASLMDGGGGMILLGSKADFTCKAGAFYG